LSFLEFERHYERQLYGNEMCGDSSEVLKLN